MTLIDDVDDVAEEHPWGAPGFLCAGHLHDGPLARFCVLPVDHAGDHQDLHMIGWDDTNPRSGIDGDPESCRHRPSLCPRQLAPAGTWDGVAW